MDCTYLADIVKEWRRNKTKQGEEFSYPAPENARGFYFDGFIQKNDSAADFSGWEGLFFDVQFENAGPNEVTVTLKCADHEPVSKQLTVLVPDSRSCRIEALFDDFPVELVNKNAFCYITAVLISAKEGSIHAEKGVCLKKRGIYIQMPVRGKSAEAGETISYEGKIFSCMSEPAVIQAEQEYEGWESIKAELEGAPAAGTNIIMPYESMPFTVKLKVHDNIVPGGHEETRIRVTARTAAETIRQVIHLKTMRRLPHPYIYHDSEGWKQVMEKIQKHDIYTAAFNRYIETADSWNPQPPYKVDENKEQCGDVLGSIPYCYETKEETNAMSAAYAYELTGNVKYAEKLALFFRYFTDEENGYPKRKRGCSQSYVQEGHFFQHLAVPYDIICDSGVLTEADKKAVEKTFRLYMDTLDGHLCSGQISNWLISEVLGAVYCALALQDIERAERFVFGNGGMVSQFCHGIFNDGWWHECSVGYNIWVSSMMIHLAHSMLPFGYNLLHAAFRIPYNKEVSSVYGCSERKVLSGMYNQKWGQNLKNSVCIKDMFDAALPFIDYRGVLFGIADSDEKKLSGVHFGSTYDLAYAYYKDPAYLPIMLRSEPDPVFGMPEIYEQAERIRKQQSNGTENAYADNIGLAMLRSHKPGREPKEQIQAVLRYGSHGGAHGHFDTTELLSVMRYGRSFFNPEHCWWGYAHFMYKFYVQCSLTKNMVVVDDKMQIPADSRRILFTSGDGIQTAGVEIKTKWAYPPYGGMVYYQDGQTADKESLRRRCRLNACWLPIAEGEDSPVYGEMSAYTEDILQRRVMAVMDDYIVLFDYAEGEKQHFYDRLFQIKGFKGIEGDVVYSGHTEQMTDNILSDGQFITDCSWYQTQGVTKASFETIFTEKQAGEALSCDRSNYNDPGILKMDVYTAWPPKSEQMTGRVAMYDGWAASANGYTVPLQYKITGQSAQVKTQVLAEGAFDGWILGREEPEFSIEGLESVQLEVLQGCRYDEAGKKVTTPQCIFWGSIRLQKRDGSWIELGSQKDIKTAAENTDPGYGIGLDYKGGRVTIVGTQYDYAVPASPIDHEQPGTITIDLKGLDAVRMRACIGVDAFAGDEWQKRKTYAVRSEGKTAKFITVIEPYENQSKIKKVAAKGEDCVEIWLADGSVQEVSITKMEEGTPKVELKRAFAEKKH